MEQLLHWTLRRLRLAFALRKAVRTAMLAVPLALLAFIALRLWPLLEPAWLALLPGALAPLAVLLGAYLLHQPAKLTAAVTLDHAGQLKEATSTAIAFQGKGLPAELTQALDAQARAASANLKPQSLRRQLPLPGTAWLAAASLVLLLGALLGLQVPALTPPIQAQGQKTPEELAKEAQQVREAARKTDAELARLQQAAELRKMEALRRAAMDARRKMDELQRQPTSKRDALAEFSKLADQARAERRALLGTEGEVQFGKMEASDPLSELARELDRIDPTGLDADLEQFEKALKEEAEAARKEGREPVVDRRKLEDLIERSKEAQRALEELQKRMEENPALKKQLQEMTDKQRELLKKINEQLERLEGA